MKESAMSVLELATGLGVICMVVFVVTSILITVALEKRGIRTNFLLIRLLLPKYAYQYKTVTKRDEGKTGALFYWWVLSINCAFVCFLLAVITV